MIRTLGGMIGCEAQAAALVGQLAGLEEIRARAARLARRPRVYFEEWDEPQISGIRWVSELIGVAGGEDCFPELASSRSAKNRIIAEPAKCRGAPGYHPRLLVRQEISAEPHARSCRLAGCARGRERRSATRSSPRSFCSRARRP